MKRLDEIKARHRALRESDVKVRLIFKDLLDDGDLLVEAVERLLTERQDDDPGSFGSGMNRAALDVWLQENLG